MQLEMTRVRWKVGRSVRMSLNFRFYYFIAKYGRSYLSRLENVNGTKRSSTFSSSRVSGEGLEKEKRTGVWSYDGPRAREYAVKFLISSRNAAKITVGIKKSLRRDVETIVSVYGLRLLDLLNIGNVD